MTAKKILVTGGLGAVGTYLVKELRGRGHHVFVADTRHSDAPNYARRDVGEYRQSNGSGAAGGGRPVTRRARAASTWSITWPRNSAAGTARTITRTFG